MLFDFWKVEIDTQQINIIVVNFNMLQKIITCFEFSKI